MEKEAYGDIIPDYSMFIDNTFTEIEEEQDIDIQEIKEVDLSDDIDIDIVDKVNDLIKAVKQLDRKINQ